MDNLFEQLGGRNAVRTVVEVFYKAVMQDKRIAHFFDGVDMSKQMGKQAAFLTMAFGGPNNYTGADMRKAHAPLVARGLDDSHFDAVVENLANSLKACGVGQPLIDRVAAIAESVRSDVLGK